MKSGKEFYLWISACVELKLKPEQSTNNIKTMNQIYSNHAFVLCVNSLEHQQTFNDVHIKQVSRFCGIF